MKNLTPTFPEKGNLKNTFLFEKIRQEQTKQCVIFSENGYKLPFIYTPTNVELS